MPRGAAPVEWNLFPSNHQQMRRCIHIVVLNFILIASFSLLLSSLHLTILQPVYTYIHKVSIPQAALDAAESFNDQRNFMMAFSGHQGSSAVADMLASLPDVIIPGFEPLDVAGLGPEHKLNFMAAAYDLPRHPSAFPAWKDKLFPPDAKIRVDKKWSKIENLPELAAKTVSGFKFRPYVLPHNVVGSNSNASHTGMTGLDPSAIKSLLASQNVSILLTLRQNAVKEALSWHKAIDMGIRQFDTIKQHNDHLRSQPVSVNITAMLSWLEYVDIVNELLQSAVREFQRPTHVIYYEDFLEDSVGVVKKAAEFIGANGEGVQASSKFVKMGSDDLKEAITNFKELCVALQGTRHFSFLEVDNCQGSNPAITPKSISFQEKSKLSIHSTKRQLLTSWCTAEDKAVSGWHTLSDTECMQRFLSNQQAAIQAVRNGTGLLIFKHVHKAGGSTVCQLAQKNGYLAEDVALPFRTDWTTNCVPYEAFLGPHPAVGNMPAAATAAATAVRGRRKLQAAWLGGACFLGFLTPAQLQTMRHHYRPLNFLASEGPLPDAIPLDQPLAMFTMLRNPLDRVMSSYKWWKFMVGAMPQSPTECHAYTGSSNATLRQWLQQYPDNWMTRELVGAGAIYRRAKPNLLQLTDAHLLQAKQRLHLFSAVLIMEQWKSSMQLMQKVFGWRDVDYTSNRAGSREDSSAAVELRDDPQLLEELDRRNQLDLALYDYALVLHEAQLKTYKP